MKAFGVGINEFVPVALLALGRRQCLDPERMNVRCQKSGQRIINHSMALNPVSAFEFRGHDGDVEMAPAVPRTLVARMQVTLILDPKFHRLELGPQRFPD